MLPRIAKIAFVALVFAAAGFPASAQQAASVSIRPMSSRRFA